MTAEMTTTEMTTAEKMTAEKMTAEKTTSREASDEPVPKKLCREVKPTNCLDSYVDED